MYTLRQNRWMALLIGVLLVCFSAICLLLQNELAEKLQHKTNMGLNRFGSVNLSVSETAAKTEHIQSASSKTHFQMPLRLQNVNNFKLWKSKTKVAFVGQLPSIPPKAETVLARGQLHANTKPKAVQVEASHRQKQNLQLTPPKTLFFSRTKLLSPSEQAQATWQYNVTAEDVLLLQKIVMAEAEGEPYQGKIAVANVVLNRLRSANFPNTIKKVIYQKHQFSPVANGRFDRVKPNKDCIRAVNEALNGKKAVTDDTYFFLSLKLAQDLTIHHTRTYEKRIGNHTFYK
ncbi:cell wall hydrolase [Paenibacillus sp. VCA1]|uniref:cell wall hydrolase n=1 Tax=Paenibacillus sp. VCA1 TaxID=3039148 RepID=UPI00287291B2|nr:cell wall hydrolase [Paenibacillus sp. VCA1]MDR9856003.1 cell wall hydrolase [Paenibacillus sp. VCA1]